MKQKAYLVTLIIVMVVFLSAILFTGANSSYAASAKKKAPAAVKMSAVDYTEAQIKQLQGALNITEAQQELWNDLTTAMRENAKDMEDFTKERAQDTKPMNAVEHLKFHSQITQTHLNQLEKLIPPFEAFYNSLSDEQKTIMDTTFRTGKHEKQKRK